jgi:hypothetical protein
VLELDQRRVADRCDDVLVDGHFRVIFASLLQSAATLERGERKWKAFAVRRNQRIFKPG